jgi:AAA15 family ATPase/GTPase
MTVEERNRLWLENKHKKIEALKSQKVDPELIQIQQCTFKPQINRKSARVIEQRRSSIDDSLFTASIDEESKDTGQ